MKLAIFDIDGTLSRSPGLGSMAYESAFQEAFGFESVNTNWWEYTYSTDSGIFREILEEGFGRAVEDHEFERGRQAYFEHFERVCEEYRDRIHALDGAIEALQHLREKTEWELAIASGNWRHVGELKLAHAGFDVDGLPAGYADDGLERYELIDVAHARSRELHKREAFDKVVYVGDGPWDVRATKHLGMPFLGVRGNGRDAELEEAGARHFIDGYQDLERVMQALEECD